jgi:hypothetical protein
MEEFDIPLTPVQSSQIKAVGYDAGRSKLRVQFHGSGATYDYDKVPAETAAAFQKAESIGKYFGANVKGKFDYTRLATPKKQ